MGRNFFLVIIALILGVLGWGYTQGWFAGHDAPAAGQLETAPTKSN